MKIDKMSTRVIADRKKKLMGWTREYTNTRGSGRWGKQKGRKEHVIEKPSVCGVLEAEKVF